GKKSQERDVAPREREELTKGERIEARGDAVRQEPQEHRGARACDRPDHPMNVGRRDEPAKHQKGDRECGPLEERNRVASRSIHETEWNARQATRRARSCSTLPTSNAPRDLPNRLRSARRSSCARCRRGGG